MYFPLPKTRYTEQKIIIYECYQTATPKKEREIFNKNKKN